MENKIIKLDNLRCFLSDIRQLKNQYNRENHSDEEYEIDVKLEESQENYDNQFIESLEKDLAIILCQKKLTYGKR